MAIGQHEDWQVRARHYEECERDPELCTADDLNNFPFRCPGGSYRRQSEADGKLDALMTRAATLEQGYSSLRLGQTYRQFFEAIDRAVDEAKVSLQALSEIQGRIDILAIGLIEKIRHAVSMAQASGGAVVHPPEGIERDELAMKMREMLLPVYLLLRHAGYSHHDLTV